MQDLEEDREVLTPPRKKVRDVEKEMPKGIWKAPTKFPPTMRERDVSVPVKAPKQRKQPPLVQHVAGVWESASSGSGAWRPTPPTRC